MCNIGNGDFGSLKNLKNACVLVSWVGSDPDERYDIISVNDVVFDNKFTLTSLKVSESVMVKCGKAKSLATVKMISGKYCIYFFIISFLQKSSSLRPTK